MATKVKPSRLQITGTPQAGNVPVYVDQDTFQRGAGGGGGGDVTGPASATDGHLAVFDGATGKIIKDGGAPTPVIDNLNSTSSTSSLSANQGKVLNDKIEDLFGLGKFLSLWDATTGLPISFPLDTPYTYSTGDYFLVETISSATPPVNYKPNGSSYTGTASSTTESDELEVGDVYIYDGSAWLLQSNHGKTVTFANIAGDPYDNTNLANALADKQDKLVSGTNIKTVNGTSILGSGDIVTPNTTYSDATQSAAGLMSASDKTKLDGIEAQAQKNTVTGVKGNAESTFRIGKVNITPANLGLENKAAASGGADVSLVTTGDKYNWNNIVIKSATAPSSPTAGMVWYDTTNNVLKVYNGSVWKTMQELLVSGTNIKSINGNSLLGSGDLEIDGGHDYSWKTKTGASFKIDLRSYIEPSQNFTVNLPDELEDGMEYVLRCVNGATAYTMTLGTGFTNPRNVSLSLNSYASDQFVFVAINGELELQPEPQLK